MLIPSCVYSDEPDFVLFFLSKLILFFTFAAKDSDHWNQKSIFIIFDFNLIFFKISNTSGKKC